MLGLFKNRQAGTSLMSAIVATFIVGVVIVGIAQMSALGMKSQKSTELRSDVLSVKQMLDTKMDCAATLNSYGTRATSCTSGTSVAIKDAAGATVIPAGGARLGAWWVAARCEALTVNGASKVGLSVYATRPDGKGGFREDPLRSSSSNRVYFNESHPVSLLYKTEVRPCGCVFDGTNCAPNSVPVATNTPTSCTYGVKSYDHRTSSTQCLTLTEFCTSAGLESNSTGSGCASKLRWELDRTCSSGSTSDCFGRTSTRCPNDSPNGTTCTTEKVECVISTGLAVYECDD